MAKASEQEHNGSTLARAGKRKWGYDTSQVDEFLERVHALYEEDEPKISQSDIQNTAFSLQKNGYVISQVDAALHRLENAVVDKQTQWDIAQAGRVAWQAQTQSLAQTLLPRASRAAKQRFADGPARKPSYDRKQVDRFVDQIVGKLNRELGFDEQPQDNETAQADSQITASSIANVIFTQRKGKHGYAERQVDAYLNRAIQVFSRLESYARLEESLDHIEESRDAEQQSDAFDAATQALHPVVPLFPQATVEGQREEERPEFGYVSQYSASHTLADGVAQAQQPTSIFAPSAAATDAVATVASTSNAPAQDGQVAHEVATASTTSLANSESSSFEALRRQEQAIFNQDTQSEAVQQFSVDKASQPETQSVSQSNAAQPAAAQPPVFAPANFEFSTQQSQSQRNDEAKYREEPEQEGERTTSFTPIFDESEFGSASSVQQQDAAQQQSSTAHESTSADIREKAANQASEKVDAQAQGAEEHRHQDQDVSSAAHIDDDYFTKLLGMDSIESTDFHIPNLVFPSADTPEEDAAQQRLG